MHERTEVGAPATVLHLLDCLNPGGTENQLLGQLRFVDRRRWRPVVAAFHEGGVLLPDLEAMRIPVAAFPLRRRLADPNTALQLGRLVAHCRREQVRIVHAHDFYADVIGLVVARLAGARVIASRRDLAHWLSPAQKRVLGLACRAADRVVVNARAIAEGDEGWLAIPPSRMRVIRNGIDLERFDREAEPEPSPTVEALSDPARRGRTVVVVSNMNLPDKGQGDVVEAAALLTLAGQPIEVLLVGDGAERPRLEEQVDRMGLGRSIHFLGRRLDVPRLLARAAAACLPSWAEGFPNAAMEAMAAGRPLVATAVGGCRELVDDGATGWLVPPRDPTRLARAIARIFTDGEAAAAMGARARESVGRRFSLRSAAVELDGVYRELAGG